MAIRDLLWACPACHRVESISDDGLCHGCGARFSRGRGARIRAVTGGRTREEYPATWLSMLPWPDLDGEGRTLPPGLEPPFRQMGVVRLATGQAPLRRGPELVGFVERFGPATRGGIVLTGENVIFRPLDGRDGWLWPLVEVSAVQPSSSAIQIKARSRPVASLRFEAGSIRLWEQRFLYCVRRAYAAAGQGEIVEFQPQVRTR